MRFSKFNLIVVFLLGVILVSACGLVPAGVGEDDSPTQTPLLTPTPTQLPAGNDAGQIDTPMPVCTPPPCTADEIYYCPGECIGGCGTVCATRTPTPLPEDAEIPDSETAEPLFVDSFPDSSQYHWALVAEDLTKPLGLVHAGDDSGRLFVLEQQGLIRIIQNGILLPTPFLDIRDRVDDGSNEQGLLGLAFHPDFEDYRSFFVNYTGRGGDTFISQFALTGDPNIANPVSETILLHIEQPYANHNGGHLVFGPDGYLYIGTGDGGSGGDPQGNAQNLNTLLGKMLRIDVDRGEPYAVPDDNPFLDGSGRSEIWAYGLRNPWRYAFDRVTGDLYIADVGQNTWEEISYLEAGHPGGANFGWDFWEGSHPFEGNPPEGSSMITPIWDYDHTQGCSVTGGYVYRGRFPEWQGIYLYSDYCSGIVWGLLRDVNGDWQNTVLFQTGLAITSFGEDEYGELYLVDRSGSVYRLDKLP